MTQEFALPPALAWTAGPIAGRAGTPATLPRCLLLAVLLHGLVIAIFGTAPGGSLRQGDSLWGAIEVTLGGAGPPNSPGQAETPLPYTGPIGRAPQPRWGGEVRDAPARPSPEPGAAELGSWNPTPTAPAQRSPATPLPQDAEPAPRLAPVPMLTRTAPQSPERREDPVAATSTAPPVVEPPPRPALEPTPALSTAPRLAPADTAEAPVLDKPQQAQRDIARPMAAPPTQVTPPTPPAPQREEQAAAPPKPAVAVPTPSSVLPVISDRAPAPPPQPIPSETLLAAPQPPLPQAVAPVRPPPAPDTARPVEPAPTPQPRAAPAAPTPSAVSAEPVARVPAVPSGSPVSPVREIEAPAPAAARSTLPIEDGAARPAAGSPDAGARTGNDRATPPSALASAPRLNLELPRARGALPSILGTRGLLDVMPPPPERKSRLAEGIEKAGKADCRNAYSGMGALAVVPLAIDAAKGSGCKW